jgi:hypothetical protein
MWLWSANAEQPEEAVLCFFTSAFSASSSLSPPKRSDTLAGFLGALAAGAAPRLMPPREKERPDIYAACCAGHLSSIEETQGMARCQVAKECGREEVAKRVAECIR